MQWIPMLNGYKIKESRFTPEERDLIRVGESRALRELSLSEQMQRDKLIARINGGLE